MSEEDILCPEGMQADGLYDVTYLYCVLLNQNNAVAIPLFVDMHITFA